MKKLPDLTDWGRVKKMRDKDIDFSDVPMATSSMLKQASIIKRGRPVKQDPKQQINLRLDPDIIESFQRGGPGWQTRINDALRHVIKLGSLV